MAVICRVNIPSMNPLGLIFDPQSDAPENGVGWVCSLYVQNVPLSTLQSIFQANRRDRWKFKGWNVLSHCQEKIPSKKINNHNHNTTTTSSNSNSNNNNKKKTKNSPPPNSIFSQTPGPHCLTNASHQGKTRVAASAMAFHLSGRSFGSFGFRGGEKRSRLHLGCSPLKIRKNHLTPKL